MRVLVTGATGFVGKAIVAELRKNFLDTVAIGGPRSSLLHSEGRELQVNDFIDITDPNSVAGLERFEGITVVIHAAGLAHQFGKVTEADLFNVNCCGTQNVAKLAERLKAQHFILISSVLVYGREHAETGDHSPLTEVSPCHPDDPYSRSKLAAEQIATEICENSGIPLTILRPAPIIGDGNKGNFLRLIKLIAKRRFLWLGEGRNRKSLVVVDDVANACRTVLQKKRPETEIFNISGKAMEMREIVNEISKRLSQKPSKIFIPAALVIGLLKIIPGGQAYRLVKTIEKWISDDIYSAEQIKLQYGFSASADLTDAIRREVASYLRTK